MTNFVVVTDVVGSAISVRDTLGPLSATHSDRKALITKDGSRENGFIGPSTSDPYRELIFSLNQFGATITEQCSLQFQKDSLTKALEQRSAEYAKSSRHFAEFPAAAESQKAAMQRAQKELEEVETKLTRKQGDCGRIVADIAERVVPSNQGTDSGAYIDLSARVDELSSRQSTMNRIQTSIGDQQRNADIKLAEVQHKQLDAQASWR
jgi:hypothetical protein